MPEYLSPGVYVEEIDTGSKPIEGVSTSTVGFVGETERGPLDPILVCSMAEFERYYGGIIPFSNSASVKSFLPQAAKGFFENGGKRCFVARVVGQDNKTATAMVGGGGTDVTPRSIKITKQTLSSLKAKKEPEEIIKKIENLIDQEFTEQSLANQLNELLEDEKVAERIKKKVIMLQTKPSQSHQGEMLTVAAANPGTWGNRIEVTVDRADLLDPKNNKLKVTISYWKSDTQFANRDDQPPHLFESFEGSINQTDPDFLADQINRQSNLIKIDGENLNPLQDAAGFVLEGGSNGVAAGITDYEGKRISNEFAIGLKSFEDVDEISIVGIPAEFSNNDDYIRINKLLALHCENAKDRFAILQSRRDPGLINELLPPVDSKYAAFYYPWLKVSTEGRTEEIPPTGHLAGIYARTDVERGVHKAPANEVVRGILGLTAQTSKGQQDILNPRGVNCIRSFPGRGIRVWGARTTSSDPLWKYINVRRLFLAIEESIDEGTQWVVFEPNHQSLWARVKQSITQYLTSVWREGALMGMTRDEAFFVTCDETTMTQNDIDIGRLIVKVGIAPVKPAEFVIFRITQSRNGMLN